MPRTPQTCQREVHRPAGTTNADVQQIARTFPAVSTKYPNRPLLFDINNSRHDALDVEKVAQDPDIFKIIDHDQDQSDLHKYNSLVEQHFKLGEFKGMSYLGRRNGVESWEFEYSTGPITTSGPGADKRGEYEVEAICGVRIGKNKKKDPQVQYLTKFRGWDDVGSMLWLGEKFMMHVRESMFDFYRRSYSIYLGSDEELFKPFKNYTFPSAFQTFLYRGLSSPYIVNDGIVIGAPVNVYCSTSLWGKKNCKGYRPIGHCPLQVCDRVCCGGRRRYPRKKSGVPTRDNIDYSKVVCTPESTTTTPTNWMKHLTKKHLVPCLPWNWDREDELDEACSAISEATVKNLNVEHSVFRPRGFYGIDSRVYSKRRQVTEPERLKRLAAALRMSPETEDEQPEPMDILEAIPASPIDHQEPQPDEPVNPTP